MLIGLERVSLSFFLAEWLVYFERCNFNSGAEFFIVNEDFRDLPNTFLAFEKPGIKADSFVLK
jgi:hypothetical protein